MSNAKVTHEVLQSGDGWVVVHETASFSGYTFKDETSFVVLPVSQVPVSATDAASLEALRKYTALGKLARLSNGESVFVVPGSEAGIPKGVSVIEVVPGA